MTRRSRWERVESLFEPFRRHAWDRTGSIRSVGLGLSIVRSVAAVHYGSATAKPLPDGGLEVAVELPLVAPSRPPLP
jgi:signal transduction histidine kinase